MLYVHTDGTRRQQLEDILAFWTGADSIPPMGFTVPSIIDDDTCDCERPLSVAFYNDKHRLPYSSTCCMRLWLPTGVDDLLFNDLFSRSLTESAGFGKA